MSTPIKTSRVKVYKLILNQDMGGIHKLRSKHRQLPQGSCLIAFNNSQTMARIIDWRGGVHTYYANEREIFDLDTLTVLVKAVFYIELTPGKIAESQVGEMWEAA